MSFTLSDLTMNHACIYSWENNYLTVDGNDPGSKDKMLNKHLENPTNPKRKNWQVIPANQRTLLIEAALGNLIIKHSIPAKGKGGSIVRLAIAASKATQKRIEEAAKASSNSLSDTKAYVTRFEDKAKNLVSKDSVVEAWQTLHSLKGKQKPVSKVRKAAKAVRKVANKATPKPVKRAVKKARKAAK